MRASRCAVAVLVAAAFGTAGCQLRDGMGADKQSLEFGACNPEGAHARHAAFACATCHACEGAVAFDPAGRAVSPGLPAPAHDTSAKSCSAVACHGNYSGTFSYWVYPRDEESQPWLKTVTYSSPGQPTPSWYAAGTLGCGGCHGNPPSNYYWHTQHRGYPGYDNCQVCHPDATGSNGAGIQITNATLHGNGTVDVAPQWRGRCFYCH